MILYDEYCVKTSKQILPLFSITFKTTNNTVIIWRDKALERNKRLVDIIKKDFLIFSVKTSKDAYELLKRPKGNGNIKIISNGGDDGNIFVDYIRNKLKKDYDILIYCFAVDYHQKWAKKYKNIKVTKFENDVQKFVKNGL